MKRQPTVALTSVLSLLLGLLVTVALPQTAQAAEPGFRAAVSANSSTATPTITVPTAVQSGDQLVYIVTSNTATTTTTPTGWTLRGTASDGTPDMTSWVFTRVAAASTAGSTVSLTLAGTVGKVSRTLLAYSGAASPAVVNSSIKGASSTTFATAGAPVTVNDTKVISYWADKTAGNTGWTLPTPVTSRSTSIGSGSGQITAAAGDSGVDISNWSGATATSSIAGTKAIGWTIVVPPAAAAAKPPVADFSSSCTLRVCTFDGRGSTPGDSAISSYSWNFGDGTSGTGPQASRTYAANGAFTVTLTVTDAAGATDTETATVNPFAPVGAHTRLAPADPRSNHIRITAGEIWDLEYIGNRVFIAGGFTTVANNQTGNTTSYTQRYLAAYNIDTGLVDTAFRPTFDSSVTEIEASPDGTRLYAVGRFNTVNGVTKRKVVALNATNGSVITGFTANTNGAATSVDATNSTVYIGGQFTTINNVARVSLGAVNATTGAVDTGFVNNLSGGIGVDGLLTVQALVLTPDQSKLMVVHTGRQIAGQDRYGVGLINTQTKQLLPWRTRLWDENLSFVGGVQRIYAGAIAPNGQYFVVGSGSGGDRPPINDTAVAFPIDGGDNMQPLWVSRMFDSVYSLAISDVAVYAGGHMNYMESPTAPDPWPGLTNVGYGRGQGLAGYGLGDDIVIREHIGAIDPATGKALEWSPESNSYEGNKAMLVMPRGVITGGDATTQGGRNIGRIAFYDFNSIPTPGANETRIINPIEGRVEEAAVPFTVEGTATATSGVQRVQLEVFNRDTLRYLQDDLTTWGAANTFNVALASPGAASTNWSQSLTISGNQRVQIQARTYAVNGTNDATKAIKKIETFGLADPTPQTSINLPSGGVIASTTFTMTGTATDDPGTEDNPGGINAINISIHDEANRYLQDDGTASTNYNTIRVIPDVVGATAATWSTEITLPYEGRWAAEAISVDVAGQADLRGGTREWLVSATAVPPTVSISSPAIVNPPVTTAPITMVPGSAVTFSGTAVDDQGLDIVEISLRNTTTRENLTSGCTWGVDTVADWCRITADNLPGTSVNWSWTTPFTLVPGTYTFSVRATDDLELATSSANQGRLTINVQLPGDAPPDGRLNVTGTVTGVPSLNLDIAGTATDDKGVKEVRISVRKRDTNTYVQPNGSLASAFATRNATLGSPGARSTTFNLPITLPAVGDYDVTAFAVDSADQLDTSTSGATARYQVFPGDTAPVSVANLFAPAQGATFTQSRIVTSGRFEDDQQMASVQVGIRNLAGQYMSSSGTFTSTTESYRGAFLNSPGSPGSNFSYTSPIIPAGTYTLFVRGVDQNGLVTTPPVQRIVTVAAPATNAPPVAAFTSNCVANVCTFDGRTSTDENAPTLTYSWAFGTNQGTATGPVPIRTYTAPGTFTVTLTVQDEFGATAIATGTVTITVPASNTAPTAVNNPPSCLYLVCNFSAVGSVDPNLGDTITYAWTFTDGGGATVAPASTVASPSVTFPAAGTYNATVTVTDGWGVASAPITRTVTVVAATNTPPVAAFTYSCAANVCTFDGRDSTDENASTLTYSWAFGQGSAAGSGSVATYTYTAPGTYTVTLTVRDELGATHQAMQVLPAIAEPPGNLAPTAVNNPPVCFGLVCNFSAVGSLDPNVGDTITYSWNFGDTPATTSTAVSPTKAYAAAGTYTVTLTVKDGWGKQTVVPVQVTVPAV